MKDKLNYENLKLGEKAKEDFFSGKSAEYIQNNCPVYLNTKPVFAGLNVTDLSIAGILAGLNSLYVGDTGCGKSQLAQDFYNYYFNGNQLEQGHGVKIRGRSELDIYEEVYRDIDKKEMRWVPNDNIKGMMHYIDEINRCPEVTQNQFFGLGDGFLEHKGMKAPLGKDGYSVSVATANLGNGEFGGAFESDKALYNRFAITLDFDYEMFQPTQEDQIIIDYLRSANPKIKEAPKRDISGLIIEAEEEISKQARNPGLEAFAITNYIKLGLKNCQEYGIKEKNWPLQCSDCPKNKDDGALCSLVRAPQPRTVNSLIKYATALDYLIKLKDPKENADPVDLVFKAFELTGAYQHLLNPAILKADYVDQSPKMIKEVVDRLKEDFRKNEDFILSTSEKAQNGDNFNDYFSHKKEFSSGYNQLKDEAKKNVKKISPEDLDKREIGLSWLDTQAKIQSKVNKIRKK